MRVVLVISMMLMSIFCSSQICKCDERFFYPTEDVIIREFTVNSDSSSAYIVYRSLLETIFYSPGISIVSLKNGLPSGIVVHRLRINKERSYQYQSQFGWEFKKSNLDLESFNCEILDSDYVIHIPLEKLKVEKRYVKCIKSGKVTAISLEKWN